MAMRIPRTLVLGVILVLILTGCQGAGGTPTPAAASPTSSIPTPTEILATPYAQQPAAGICASFDGELVTVTLNPDIPDPRCSLVRADQELRVENHTSNTVQISIGRFNDTLEAGKEIIIATPFGEYLQTGVHQLQVSPCCSAELWLKEK